MGEACVQQWTMIKLIVLSLNFGYIVWRNKGNIFVCDSELQEMIETTDTRKTKWVSKQDKVKHMFKVKVKNTLV